MMKPLAKKPDPGQDHKNFAIIGGGKVGVALARQLLAAGYTSTGIACQTKASAEKAAELAGLTRYTSTPWQITSNAGIVFITTPDSAIADTCRDIAAHRGFGPGAVVLHCSGALPSTILTVPDNMDIARGSFHPLQSFATTDMAGNPFQDIIAAVEGDPAAVTMGQTIGRSLGATCFEIKTEGKSLYHAAAVVASNYLITLLENALTLLEAAGIDRADALTILRPLIKGTLANIDQAGIPQALTGPVARGDLDTIATHLDHIRTETSNLLPFYKMMGEFTIPIALAKGTLSEAAAHQLQELFQTSSGPSETG